ncbi:hypothetical protein ALC60_00480 [Trachymyrmex zeteki]|uniref:Uncharacterized protein n=1 Tax=Mycetomoellerius zeteki TaxID=64791 RepID=A0A151XJI7_9HYME|nr:hypothetical protein ALC60_00480 [Trachymyrmex zeteki]
MSGLPERSLLTAAMQKWNTLMVGMSAKQVLAEQQLKGAELKVENAELSCGGMQRPKTAVGIAIRYFGEAATRRRVYVASFRSESALGLPALFSTSYVAR